MIGLNFDRIVLPDAVEMMLNDSTAFDVLCVGHASYDMVFAVDHHPDQDEKMFADRLFSCGGGPAANAAVTAAKLGCHAAFAGYLGGDVYGDSHLNELQQLGIDTRLIVRGDSPTPVSAILVKPDGKRALVNYKGSTKALPPRGIDFSGVSAKIVLFDGHEPHISLDLMASANFRSAPTLLDAGSLHDGTRALMDKVTYLVCSEKFALQVAGDTALALIQLAATAPVVVVTLGARGLIWRRSGESGAMPAPPVQAIDTTGAGDAFHGAFAAAIAAGLPWSDVLRYASTAGAFCCTVMGARTGLPDSEQHRALLAVWQSEC